MLSYPACETGAEMQQPAARSLLCLHGFKKLSPLHASSRLFYAAAWYSGCWDGKEVRSVRRLHIGQKVREKSLLQNFPGEFPLLEERKAL